MTRQLNRNTSNKDGYKGCMGSFLHLFNFQRRLHIRKMILDRSHGKGRHTAVGLANTESRPQTESLNGDADKSFEKGKWHVRSILTEEVSMEKGKVSPLQRAMLRTISIHHLECNNYVLPDGVIPNSGSPRGHLRPQDIASYVTTECKNIPHEATADASCSEKCGDCQLASNRNDLHSGKLHEETNDVKIVLLKSQKTKNMDHEGDLGEYRTNDLLEALELYNTDRKTFMKTIYNRNSAFLELKDPQNGSVASVLTKCGSFPGAEFSGRGNGFYKEKRRMKDSYSFATEKWKSQPGFSTSTIETKEIRESQVDIPTHDEFSSAMAHGQSNGAFDHCLQGIKEKKSEVLELNKKEKHRISMDGILHKVPYGHRLSQDLSQEKYSTEKIRGGQNRSNWIASIHNNDGTSQFRRSRSLTESVERYSHLLEPSVSRESKRNIFNRSKTINEGSYLEGNPTKQWGRINSLPESELYISGEASTAQSEDSGASHRISSSMISHQRANDDTFSANKINNFSEKPIQSLVNAEESKETSNEKEDAHVESTVEDNVSTDDVAQQKCPPMSERDVCQGHDFSAEKLSHKIEQSSSYDEKIEAVERTDGVAQPTPISVDDTYCQEDDVSPTGCFVHQESAELNLRCISLEERNSLPHTESQMDSRPPRTPGHNTNNILNTFHPKLDNGDEYHFNYVKEILRRSGLISNFTLVRWYLPDQPLDPSILEQVEESAYAFDINSSTFDSHLDHQLIFDLINEEILETYDSFFSLNSFRNSCTRPISVEACLLEELWTSANRIISKPQQNHTLEYIVGRDLAKKNSWKNLKCEMKDMCQEFEEMILDDLLDEIIIQLLNPSCYQNLIP